MCGCAVSLACNRFHQCRHTILLKQRKSDSPLFLFLSISAKTHAKLTRKIACPQDFGVMCTYRQCKTQYLCCKSDLNLHIKMKMNLSLCSHHAAQTQMCNS